MLVGDDDLVDKAWSCPETAKAHYEPHSADDQQRTRCRVVRDGPDDEHDAATANCDDDGDSLGPDPPAWQPIRHHVGKYGAPGPSVSGLTMGGRETANSGEE